MGYGAETPGDIVRAAPEGFPLVIADTGLHGQAEFAREAGRRPATGAGARVRAGGAWHVLLAMRGGWSQLSSLVSRTSQGVDCLSGSDRLALLLLPGSDPDLPARLGFEGSLLGAVLPPAFGCEPWQTASGFACAGIRPVACWPVVFTGGSRPVGDSVRIHRMLRAGCLRSSEASLSGRAFASPAACMPDRRDVEGAFDGSGQALEAAAELGSGLELFRPPGGFLRGADEAGDAARLRALAEGALPGLYGGSGAAALRLSRELEAVESAGLAGYFLAFHEVMEFCRREGIAAHARGSAAGSIISRLLGLSGVCPLRCGLSFSRFFNRLRPDPPDIDLDIDSLHRDRVIGAVLDAWGAAAASVGAIVRFRRRGALRAAAVAAGLGPVDVDRMSVLLDDPGAEIWRRPAGAALLERASLLEGLPSHLAPHPCGIVRAPGPVRDFVPVEPGTDGRMVTQFDMTGVEEAGLLKMDLLGQRGLSAMTMAGVWTGAAAGGGAPVLPRDAAPAFSLLSTGRTIGVAHVESPALRGLLREMRASTLDDVARALALVRPGAAGGGARERFFAARSGRAPSAARFEELRDLLAGNMGELLYEDDVAECASRLLGVDEAEGDLIRRRLRKRLLSPGDLAAMGIAPGRAARVHEFLSGFAGYGFCRAHAYSYAAAAVVSAVLKATRPAEHMAAVLACGGGFYDQRTYVEEARRLGLSILPPQVNTGEWSARPVEGGIMLGFETLRGMGPSEFAALRAARPCFSPSRLVAAGVGRSVVRSMAMAGCFAEIGLGRGTALWETGAGTCGLFTREELRLPELPEHGLREMVSMDLHLLGAAVSCNPLSLVERPDDTVPMDRMPGRGRFSVWGRVASRRGLEEGAGFLMLEDDRGYADVFLPPPLYGMARLAARRDGSTLVMRVTAGPDGRLRASSVSTGPLTPFALVV